mmetsp:Transcript_104799/g.163387  ORF Transcript_104799/g.163387 Transcript_104799/m.163387 type:complete len:91 (-) Transcript_104799:401-673(-)
MKTYYNIQVIKALRPHDVKCNYNVHVIRQITSRINKCINCASVIRQIISRVNWLRNWSSSSTAGFAIGERCYRKIRLAGTPFSIPRSRLF